MCGIVGIVARRSPAELERAVLAMNETLVHRGPDDGGHVVVPDAGVALAMRRLSVVDIEGGHQPMWDEERRHGVVFNGEIYNFAELRRELAGRGHRFASDHSDTEVLVHGWDEWGEGLLPRLNGMFAFAVWDGPNRRLVVARDRAGEKPLYLARLADGYAFASELKALFALAELDRTLDPVALEQYLAFDYVVAPRTILRAVRKLPAAHFAPLAADGYTATRYWQPSFARTAEVEDELVARFDRLLDESVRRRLVADVPLGLFLSGGLDSTTVGWYMRRHVDRVESFSIGFEDRAFDESRHAADAARVLGTEHHLEVFSDDRVRELVPRVPELLDEPMGDRSIFPTFLLATTARTRVTVALGGDGSDELLMGYRAHQALRLSWTLDRLPGIARRSLAAAAVRAPDAIPGVAFARLLRGSTGERLLAYLSPAKGRARWLLSAEIRAALPASPTAEPLESLLAGVDRARPEDVATAVYLRGYLVEDILAKVDRASMAASLEVRTPFLDPELIDFLLTVPPELKLRRLTRKYLLRRLMAGRIPDRLIARRKFGFGAPVPSWLRGPLAPLVRELLAPGRVAAAGVLEPAVVARLVDEHLSGSADRGELLWPLLQLELWRERWLA